MDEKYLYVAYSETDYESVDNILLEVYKRGIAIKSAKDFAAEDLESGIANATAFLFVISPESIYSKQLQHYFHLAEQFNLHILPYFLLPPEETPLFQNFFMRVDGCATIPAYEYAEERALVQRTMEELLPYFPDNTEPKKKKSSHTKTILVAALAGVAVLVSYFLWFQPAHREKVLNNTRLSTVYILNVIDEEAGDYGTGSGFFIDEDGTIATNYHVIEDAETLYVQPFGDNMMYSAEVLCYDKEADLALLLVDDLCAVNAYLTFSSKSIHVGDSIYVSGYPRGIDLTISNGIISNNIHYTSDEECEYFLVTAAVSPGNSGGPVIDSSGKVIGIATAKYESAENLNLIRPVYYLKKLYLEKK